MRGIGEENEFSRRTTDTLSDDLAALSYRIIGVSGGIYAAQSIAFEVPERGSRIIEDWNKVQNRLSGLADEEIQQRAARAIAGLPAFLERMSALLSVIGPVPTPEELVLLERNHDAWLDYTPPPNRFTTAKRHSTAANSGAKLPARKTTPH